MQSNYLSKLSDEWIPLQIKVFSRWVASVLKGFPDSNVQDITKDLSNGVALVELAEVLTHKKAPHIWDHKPTIKVENVQNCDLAIDMFLNDGVKLVGISGKDISDNNQKLILGLIWSLIVHYSIGNSMIYGNSILNSKVNDQKQNLNDHNPLKELISWARQRTEKYQNVNNFEPFDLAMCALLDTYYPNKINFDSLNPNDHEHNAKLAFDVMKDHGIECLVYPNDLKKNDYKVDEMTLLTQLAEAKTVLNENEIHEKGREIAFSSPEELKIKEEEAKIRAQIQREMEMKEKENQKQLEEAKLKAEEAQKLNSINEARLRIQQILNAKEREDRIKNEEARVKAEKESVKKAQEAKIQAEEETRQKVEAEYRERVENEKRLKEKAVSNAKSQEVAHLNTEKELRAKVDEAELRAKEAEKEKLMLERKLKKAEEEKAKLEEQLNDADNKEDDHEGVHNKKHYRIKIKVHHNKDEEEHKKYKIGIKIKKHNHENDNEHHHLVCKNIKVIRNGHVVPAEIEKEPDQNDSEKQSFHVKLLEK